MSTIVITAATAAERKHATSLKEAIAHLDAQMGGRRWPGRAPAIRSIERAANPKKEAQRLADWHHRQWAKVPSPEPLGRKRGKTTNKAATAAKAIGLVWPKNHKDPRPHPDHSDVQELRVKIANRDGALACAVHKHMLARLDAMIAGRPLTRRDREDLRKGNGCLTPEQFAKRAAEILRTPQAWPKEATKAELASNADPEMYARAEAAHMAPPAEQAAAGPLWIDRHGFIWSTPGGSRRPIAAA